MAKQVALKTFSITVSVSTPRAFTQKKGTNWKQYFEQELSKAVTVDAIDAYSKCTRLFETAEKSGGRVSGFKNVISEEGNSVDFTFSFKNLDDLLIFNEYVESVFLISKE